MRRAKAQNRSPLGKVFESVEVLVNHQNCGSTIAPPYVFLYDAVPESWENELTIKIQKNMGRGFQEIFFLCEVGKAGGFVTDRLAGTDDS